MNKGKKYQRYMESSRRGPNKKIRRHAMKMASEEHREAVESRRQRLLQSEFSSVMF